MKKQKTSKQTYDVRTPKREQTREVKPQTADATPQGGRCPYCGHASTRHFARTAQFDHFDCPACGRRFAALR